MIALHVFIATLIIPPPIRALRIRNSLLAYGSDHTRAVGPTIPGLWVRPYQGCGSDHTRAVDSNPHFLSSIRIRFAFITKVGFGSVKKDR